MKRVAHVLWRSQGGIRRHVATIARHPPCGWTTAGIWGPAELTSYFSALDFHPMRHPALIPRLHDVDVIHAHGVTAGLVALRRRDAPVVVSLHVIVGGSGTTARSRSARLVARMVAKRADGVVAASAAAARGFADATVIAPAFDPLPEPERSRDDVRRELDTAPGDPVVIVVSRLETSKRLDLFITAVEAAGAVGWLVGDGPDRERLEALATGSRVRVLGYRDDVADILRAADIFALPSASESYGIAVAEAIAAGLPVVATRTGAVEDLVAGGGVVVPVDDEDAFVMAVTTLVSDPAERARRAAAARAVALPDRAALIARLGEVYDALAAKAGDAKKDRD